MARRGKALALSIAWVGLLVLILGAVVFWQSLLEAWHIHRLRTGTIEEAHHAAEALGEMGSVNAVRELLAAPARWRAELAREAVSGVEKQGNVPTQSSDDSMDRMPQLPFPSVADAALGEDFLSNLQRDLFRFAGPDLSVAAQERLFAIQPDLVAVVSWATAALDAIGDRALPALERAAADEQLAPSSRAFARLQLTRRARASPRIALGGEGAQVSIDQCTSVPLPGSRGSVYLSVDDVGWGRRVTVWVTPATGERLVDKRWLEEGDKVSFALGGKTFVLRLEDRLIRFFSTDRAVFQLREGQPVPLAR